MDVAPRPVPGDALAASLGTSAERIRSSRRDVPVFTVVGWVGEVATADWRWESAPPRTVWAAVAHHRDSTSRDGIVVHSVVAEADDAVRELFTTRGHPPPARSEPLTAVVDGRHLSFDVVTAPGVVVEFRTTAWGSLLVEAVGTAVEALILQEVADLEPFIAGRNARIAGRLTSRGSGAPAFRSTSATPPTRPADGTGG